MTFEEFTAFVKLLADDYNDSGKMTLKDDILTHSWTTGGNSGGSCWGGEATYHTSDTPVPTYCFITELVFIIAPYTPMLHHRVFMKTWSAIDNEVQYEYYGNCVYYDFQTLDIKKLFSYFNDFDLFKARGLPKALQE
jgi:hypothetical protein